MSEKVNTLTMCEEHLQLDCELERHGASIRVRLGLRVLVSLVGQIPARGTLGGAFSTCY